MTNIHSAEEERLATHLRGKEVHIRLLVNDLLENDKYSLTAVGKGANEQALVSNAVLEKKKYTDYSPQTIFGKLKDEILGKKIKIKEEPDVVVIIEEKNGNVSADDARYIEWLAQTKGEKPGVILLPEGDVKPVVGPDASAQLDKKAHVTQADSFWKRQIRRFIALPAPITKDAALAAIPRTLFPIALSIFLAYIKRNEVTLQRVTAYIGTAFVVALAYALFNQTVLNWITFWSEFTRDAFEPLVDILQGLSVNLEKKSQGVATKISKWSVSVISFVSARGDVLLGGPLLGVGTLFILRLALGPVGQTASVLTISGFLLMLANIIVGSVTGGPYVQVIAHLRTVGKITNKASMYLGIIDGLRLELGRLADFGLQTFYNVIQVTIAVVCWLLLFVVDRCFPKLSVHSLEHEQEIHSMRKLFRDLRAREDIKAALTECNSSAMPALISKHADEAVENL